MDSWTLQGDSYSFLRSAPRTFSLHHRDGTPNHVEIFDITSIPSQSNAISETTCLCDIFGDDCESPSLSSSPASGPFLPSHKEVDRGTATSPLVDDSSGSYHTAPGSSEGEEAFEDSRERLQSPPLQTENSERNRLEDRIHCWDIIPKVEPRGASPPLASTSPEVFHSTSSARTPSPGCNSPLAPSPEGRDLSSSSSSIHTRGSLSSPNPRQSCLAAESQSSTPRSEDGHNSFAHQSSSSPQPKNSLANSSSTESLHAQSVPESRALQHSPEPRNIAQYCKRGPSPESSSTGNCLRLAPTTFEPRVIIAPNSPLFGITEISSESRVTSNDPELRDNSSDSQASSPFPELRRRVSLPDLFSRGSTSDIEGSPCIPEETDCAFSGEIEARKTPDSRLSAESRSSVSTPSRFTPSSSVVSTVPTPELRRSVSPEVRFTTPSPSLLSTASVTEIWTRSPSPAVSLQVPHASRPSESLPQALSPGSKTPTSPEVNNYYCTEEPRYTTDSPEIRITASSPELRRREQSTKENLTVNSPDYDVDSVSLYSRSICSSPCITGICYSVVEPADKDTAIFTEPSLLSTEPGSRPLLTEPRRPSPVRESKHTGLEESRCTLAVSPHIIGYTSSDQQPEQTVTTLPPQPRSQPPSPKQRHCTPPTALRHHTPSPELRHHSPAPELMHHTQSPESRHCTPSSELRNPTPSPEPRHCTPSPVLRNPTSSPESRHCTPSPELRNPSPTPKPRHCTPSPVIRNPIPSPEPRHCTPSSELRNPTPSLELRNPTPSPEPRHCTPSPELRNPTPSPELKNPTLSPELRNPTPSPKLQNPTPSPKLRNPTPSPEFSNPNPSPELRNPTPSPEPRQFTLSPELRNPTPSPELRNPTPSPEPRHYTPTPELRNPTPSPQPRHCTPSPELRNLTPSPEPRHCIPSPEPIHQSSPELRHYTPSPEVGHCTQSSEPRHLTSPQNSRYPSPSPEPGHQTLPSERYLTPSPQPRNREILPAAQFPETTCNQSSQGAPSPETDPHCIQTSLSPRDTPVVKEASLSLDLRGKQDHSQSAVNKKYQCEITSAAKPLGSEVQNISPVLKSPIHSKEPSSSQFVAQEKMLNSSSEEQSAHREKITKEISSQYNQGLDSGREKKQTVGPSVVEKESPYNNSPGELQTPSPSQPVFLENRSPENSPACKPTSISPAHRGDNPQSKFAAYSLSPDNRQSNTCQASTDTPKCLRKQPSTKVGIVIRQQLTEDMNHHVNRRTPSPPITRFTPVHIISPEKPYRDWKNRGKNPQVAAPPLTGNLKCPVTNRENPKVAPSDSYSQDHWLRRERELEMEREFQWEAERKRQRDIERGWQKGRQREVEGERSGWVQDKGEGRPRKASYRGEQVELSFGARNRKGPANHSTAPTSRENSQGMPSASSYSESLLTTRQLQQQHTLFRAQTALQDIRGSGPTKKLQPSVPQRESTGIGRVVKNRPHQSSSSSMGSELDEADNEVKWLTDVAFSSLSSPEVDYLDMYNSSHRSSTNISQPSTQESPAGANAALLAYADFRGSAPRLDNDDFPFQHPPSYYSDGCDPSRLYEMGSFECVDVAVEREGSRKVKRGVPKRQIQLKRRITTESKQDDSSENSSPVAPVMPNSPCLQRCTKETLVRQHSTPATMQESCQREPSPITSEKNEKKLKFQKSLSLDETCTKTKMATCLIKSVLSKKMQGVDKQNEEPEQDETTREVTLKMSPQTDTHNLSSSLTSHHSLSSEEFAMGIESNTTAEVIQNMNCEIENDKRPSPINSQKNCPLLKSDSEGANSQSWSTMSGKSEMKSEQMVLYDRQSIGEKTIPVLEGKHADDSERWDAGEAGDSANSTVGNKEAPFAIGSSRSTKARMTNGGQECGITCTEERKQLQQTEESFHMSKTPKNTLNNAIPAIEKKKSSINVSLTPEVENKPGLHCEVTSTELSPRVNGEKEQAKVDGKTEEEDANGNNKVKAPIHKVRDVRRLVKNTYSLSFKASTAVMPPLKVDDYRITEERHQDTREEIKGEKKESLNEDKTEVPQDTRGTEIADESKKEIMEETRELLRNDRKEERKVEGGEAKLPASSSCADPRGKFLSRQQPMLIECRAVRWKESRNNSIMTELEKSGDKPQASPQPSDTASNPANSPNARRQSNTTKDAVPCEPDIHVEMIKENARRQSNTTEDAVPCEPDIHVEMIKEKNHKMAENVSKPEVVRRDKKPPMLGNLPKVPSKEREVSTAVVVIRDGSSKPKTSVCPPQNESPTLFQAASTSHSPGLSFGTAAESSSHSVSMLLKEKGYQAEIGAVVNEGAPSTAGGKGLPRKHVNRLEIPLQTCTTSEGVVESQRERTFSSLSSKSSPTPINGHAEIPKKRADEESVRIKPPVRDTTKRNSVSPLRSIGHSTPPGKPREQGDFEAVKRQDPTFPPKSPALRRFKPQQIEVKSLSKETQKQEVSTHNIVPNRSQAIEVKSISNNSQKPVVPPKPNYKFKPPDLEPVPNDTQNSAEKASSVKPQGEERAQTIVVSSPTIYRKLSSENTASNYTRKLAVSAVSSYRPPQTKTTTTTVSSLSNRSADSSGEEQSNDRAQRQQPGASPQSSRQRPSTVPTAATSASQPTLTSSLVPAPVVAASQIPGPASAVGKSDQSAVVDLNTQPQNPRTRLSQDQAMSVTSNNTKQPSTVSMTQAPEYGHGQPPLNRSLSGDRYQRADNLQFYASDDPPSYDERESFSPLVLHDFTPKKPNRYYTAPRPPPCSCTTGCPSHPGLTFPQHHHSPHNLTPPTPTHSPGHGLSYPQPPLRSHQCRPETQPMCYQPSSPKPSALGPSQPPTMYHSLNQPPSCPPHQSLMQPCPIERPQQPHQHIDTRRPSLHRSSQQQPPGMTGVHYNEQGHGQSPGLPPLDPQYMCGPHQSLGPSYGSEYEGDSSSLYSESGFGQTPRRVLMDPETGKYFYIEVPVQPLRKMLFDPETGQYVEVLIPQQAMSHSGLYPPSAAPYQSIHNPNLYAPAPQYMQPYAAPPPPPPPHAQPLPTRPPEDSTSTMHQNVSRVAYSSPSGQGSKMESRAHPPLDQSYLEGMYYVPTGMNASPNPTPSDCYHKHPPTLPGAGGKRS